MWMALLAEAHANEGNCDNALRAVSDGLSVAEKNHEPWFDAEFYRLRGEFTLLAMNGEQQAAQAQAEQDFERAIQIAQQQQAKSWELRATMSLAKLWRNRAAADARARLASVYE